MVENFATNRKLVKDCLKDLYLDPRNQLRKWSQITNQTCQIRFAYPGQHIASVITGIKGKGTAARGDDLADGSEVKTCSRADQLSECNNCGAKVLVWQEECPVCKSHNINVKTDSHWIFTIKSKDELDLLLDRIPRILLLLFDKESNDKDDVRLRMWVVSPNNQYVRDFFNDYYHNNYLTKDNPAPCNLHPLKYDFYMMNPKLVFQAEINIEERDVDIVFWNLENPKDEEMPANLINRDKLLEIFLDNPNINGSMKKAEIVEKVPVVPKDKMHLLKMKVKITKSYKKKYTRR